MAVNNHVQLTGNLAGDVETRRLDGDRVMGKFTIAVDRIGDKKGGTDFIRVVVFGRQAANTATYCVRAARPPWRVACERAPTTGPTGRPGRSRGATRPRWWPTRSSS